ncbi:hypothetical protein CCL16_26825, partial [Pseudomonas syringae]
MSNPHGSKTPRTCGSELARERVCTNAENASTETPPSRARSAPLQNIYVARKHPRPAGVIH